MLKICYISNLYSPYVRGGAEINVMKSAEEMVRKGHDAVVITTGQKGEDYVEDINRVKVCRLSLTNICSPFEYPRLNLLVKPLYYLISTWSPVNYIKVRKALIKESPDVVHVNNFKGPSLSSFTAAKSLGLPIVFTAHDFCLVCPRGTLLKSSGKGCDKPRMFCRAYAWINRAIAGRSPDVVTAPSGFMLERIRGAGFFKSSTMVKLPLGINLSAAPEKKGYDTIDIMFAGSISRIKGIHILIKAFNEIKEENLRLHIAGKGTDEDEMRALAGDDPRIHFYGFLKEEQLMRLYRSANVVVVPSICHDNSPMVIYESLMSGTPVIASRLGGMPELIEDGYNGYLFESGNAEQLKSKLEALIKDAARLQQLERSALESVKKYSMEKYADELEKLYLSLKV